MAFASTGRPGATPRASIMEEAGQKLKRIRERLGLRYRDVEEASGKIAAIHDNDEYLVALSRLADIENKGTLPSVYRIYSLCAIYRLDLTQVLSWYGISLPDLPADAGLLTLARTHPVGFQAPEEGEAQAPIALDPGIDLSKTLFLSRVIQKWGKIPFLLMKHMDLRSHRYGLIGSDDWSMFPVLYPGSLVVLDDTRKIRSGGWRNEFDRPIYFLEHREGYACSWCMLREDRLILQPHPASNCEPESYRYPAEIEVIGQVTQVAMSLEYAQRRRSRD
ncbi:MAG TPA: helix-turn-helix transcriptional regulator [Bryobacteraceae bacterium]